MADPDALNLALRALFESVAAQASAASETPPAVPAEPARPLDQANILARLGDAFAVMYGNAQARA